MDELNQRRARLELQAFRRDSSVGAGMVIGYSDEFGVPRSFPGDAEAPWIKIPPFPSDPAPWATFAPLPASDEDYAFTPALDVAKQRIAAVWFDYTPVADQGPLSIIAQVSRTLNAPQEWFPIGVLNPTLTIVDPPGLPFPPGFGSRDFFPAEFRTNNSFQNRSVLPFDVSPYVAFRLGVIDLSAEPGALTLFYSLAT